MVDVAGGLCAASVEGPPVTSVEEPARPADGGSPKRCSEASLEDNLADLHCASLWNADSGSSRPVTIGYWVLRVDRTDRIDQVSSAPGAGSLPFFILLADCSCRAEKCSFLTRPNFLAGLVRADDFGQGAKRSTWELPVRNLLTDSVNKYLLSRSGNRMSYTEIRLVPGNDLFRLIAELAQARKGMRHRGW